MTQPRFFGYGSLVNLATHSYPNATPARLTGWRRVWRHSESRPQAFLSVEPAEDAEIDGVIADVPGADWAALDERETGYLRRDVSHLVSHEGKLRPTSVYEVDTGTLAPPETRHPILLSYLDVVVQGYLKVFGPEGASNFARTTKGWHAPILDDRAEPQYPRAQRLSEEELAVVDDLIEAVGARRMTE